MRIKHRYLDMMHLCSVTCLFSCFFRATVAQQRTIFWVNVKSITLTRGGYSIMINQKHIEREIFVIIYHCFLTLRETRRPQLRFKCREGWRKTSDSLPTMFSDVTGAGVNAIWTEAILYCCRLALTVSVYYKAKKYFWLHVLEIIFFVSLSHTI